jgi:hypothetical protein
MYGLLLVLRPGWPELDMLGDNKYSGRRLSLGVPEVFLFEPSDNSHVSSLSSVAFTLHRQISSIFNVETASFFFKAVFDFEVTAGGERKAADGIAVLIVLVIGISNQLAFNQNRIEIILVIFLDVI